MLHIFRKSGNTCDAFFALLRGGLWEQEVRLSACGAVDFAALCDLAEEQSVVGLLAAGLEHVEDVKVTRQQVLPFIKRVIPIEKRNSAMNGFIATLMDRMCDAEIYALLVKGQGIAQLYERPQWRPAGDVDLLLPGDAYERARDFLVPLARHVGVEDIGKKHIGMTIDGWLVELHGTLRSGLARRIDRVIDSVQDDTFQGGNISVWRNGDTDVPVPATDNNIVFIFSHILQHFFHGGIGLRQLCDWSRLLWTSRAKIDLGLLALRLREMRLLSEWKAFGALAVNHLGLPPDAMPFYDNSRSCRRKADKILSIILEKGRFGRDAGSGHMAKMPPLKRKFITVWRQFKETATFFRLFPLDAIRFLGFFITDGFERTRTTTTFSSAKKKRQTDVKT